MLPWILLGLFLVGQVQSSPFFDFIIPPHYRQSHLQEHESYRAPPPPLTPPLAPLILSQPSPLDTLTHVRVMPAHYRGFSENVANNAFRTTYNSPFGDHDGGNIEVQPEFVPLEHQPREQSQPDAKPFEVDLITTNANDDNGGSSIAHLPGLFFKQSFPFLGNDFLNNFGAIDFGAGAQEWWKGPNVCVEKSEEEEEDSKEEEGEQGKKEIVRKPQTNAGDQATGSSEIDEISRPLFGHFHFSLNSCIEKPNKYVCTRIINQNGKKKSVIVTRQCCHGYARPRNAGFEATCEKVDIKNIDKAAEELGAKQFVELAKTASGNGNDQEVISNASKNVTIFLPLDEALKNYNDKLQNENNVVGKPYSDNFYMAHMVSGEVSMYDVTNEQLFDTKDAGQKIRINVYPVPLAAAKEPFHYTANCVPIAKHDQLTEQGVAHTLKGVLTPVKKNVMDLIRERSDLSIVRTVLENTKLSKMLEGDKPMTIFAPTDDAFNKVDPQIRRSLKEGSGCALNILKNHMLDFTFCSVASIAGAKTSANNLLGEDLRFNRSTAEEWSENLPVKINGLATITEADIMATNGVLHIIDVILPTDAAVPMSKLMMTKNVTLFQRLLNASGLYEAFDDLQNVTIFAPTDKAIRESKWGDMLENNPEQLTGNKELEEFLNYHVVKPMTKTCDLTEALYPTLAGNDVRVNLYSTNALFSNVMNRATVNCARLVHFDDESCSSVLHQVDKVLAPQTTNLLQQLEANPQYSRFLKLVKSANLTNLLNEESKRGYTVLVPKNDVFEEVGDWEQTLTKNQADLENLVKTHIVNDVVCCAGIIPTQWPFVRSIEAVNGAHLHITRDRRPKVENAGITKCDNIATNGIIHEINDIIVPRAKPQRRPQVDDIFF